MDYIQRAGQLLNESDDFDFDASDEQAMDNYEKDMKGDTKEIKTNLKISSSLTLSKKDSASTFTYKLVSEFDDEDMAYYNFDKGAKHGQIKNDSDIKGLGSLLFVYVVNDIGELKLFTEALSKQGREMIERMDGDILDVVESGEFFMIKMVSDYEEGFKKLYDKVNSNL